MEFDEIKKVWDLQNNAPFYGFDERALGNRILSKKKQSLRITNASELLAIVAYAGSGCFIIVLNYYRQSTGRFMYLVSVWMLACALYLLWSRSTRISTGQRFDRSMRGDLAHAISMATYQVRLSALLRWNILPIGILTTLGVWDGRKSIWMAGGILVFFVLTIYAAGWEHAFYKKRKKELEVLQQKLENDHPGDHSS